MDNPITEKVNEKSIKFSKKIEIVMGKDKSENIFYIKIFFTREKVNHLKDFWRYVNSN